MFTVRRTTLLKMAPSMMEVQNCKSSNTEMATVKPSVQ